MALYQVQMSKRTHKYGSASPTQMLNYYFRQGQFTSKEPDDKYNDFRHAEHGNLPAWAHNDPYTFFNASFDHEGINRTWSTVIQGSLPRELTQDQQITFVQDFVATHLNDKPYVWMLHEKPASDGGLHPHIHLVMSERSDDGIERGPHQTFSLYNRKHPSVGGREKDPFWTQRRCPERVRESWSVLMNWHLERAGVESRVDHRSLRRQGAHPDPIQAWEAYKQEHHIPKAEQVYRPWMIEHVRHTARSGVPGKAITIKMPTIEEREHALKALEQMEKQLTQYATQLHGAITQQQYYAQSGKPLTPQMEERERRLLQGPAIPGIDIDTKRIGGIAARARIFEDYEQSTGPRTKRGRVDRTEVFEHVAQSHEHYERDHEYGRGL